MSKEPFADLTADEMVALGNVFATFARTVASFPPESRVRVAKAMQEALDTAHRDGAAAAEAVAAFLQDGSKERS